jgi:hypothetical protein
MARPTTDPTARSVSQRLSIPADTNSAKRVILDALRSSSGLARLVSQTGNIAEVGVLAALAADATVVGNEVADAVTKANAGQVGGGNQISGITASSTWSALVTAIAAS